MYAVIRIRGRLEKARKATDTMNMLGLKKLYSFRILPEDKLGMIKAVRDYVAYGEIDDDTAKLVEGKRLCPPLRGFKAIKIHYPKGDLGNRGDKINDLLKRMVR